ncbi:hypothetical protein [Frigoriflavimonas asaccharolytica]|uniref:Uncharacterized protein n=1 Tax=Frigoriflavimonas asaccharolytica TaxID=2735899 RepID=A0A8J8G9K4_9FLAO|nr:hypothetical protein [Frigoriflavimonas asaccharolytica]NRS93411.1 hypothetical protein [Frigoriflavimonas asaccharolytica]
MKKLALLFLLFAFISSSFGQEKKLLKILNQELKKEVKNQVQSKNFNGDTLVILKPFTINEQKILSFEVRKSNYYQEGYEIITQEIPLNKITAIGKDIQVFFQTSDNSVITITKKVAKNINTNTEKGNFFQLFLFIEKQNEKLGINLQNALLKTGIKVDKEYWYD